MDKQVATRESQVQVFSPVTDVVEREDGFHVFMDMPGVSKESLDIDLQEDKLVVSGFATHETADNETALDHEFGEGTFKRSMTLSDIVDREAIEASFQDGVLELVLPRVAKTEPRKIEIRQG